MIIEKEFKIKSLPEFMSKIESLDYVDGYLYRGENELFETALMPKIGRHFENDNPNSKSLFIKREHQYYNWFKTESVQYFKDYWPKHDFDYLIIGQQHGLSTRLLDFTQNPLVALYFAILDMNECKDGYVYIINEMIWGMDKYNYNNKSLLELSSKIEEYFTFIPPRYIPRISKQSGAFMYFRDPTIQFQQEVIRIKVSGTCKKKIKAYLYKFNIKENNLFHSLEGLSSSINYRFSRSSSF